MNIIEIRATNRFKISKTTKKCNVPRTDKKVAKKTKVITYARN